MPRRFYKHKLLLDEGLPLRRRFPILNGRFDVKHIAGDLRRASLPDSEVYEVAIRQNRVLITYNEKHFRKLVRHNAIGVIGVSANMPLGQLDKKLSALLTRSRPKDLFGRFIFLSGET